MGERSAPRNARNSGFNHRVSRPLLALAVLACVGWVVAARFKVVSAPPPLSETMPPRVSLPARQAAPLTVNTTDDNFFDGVCAAAHCSLRDAIADADPGDTIIFSVTGIITLAPPPGLNRGELVINKNLTIIGPGADVLAISGGNQSRVFSITAGTVSISAMTIRNGLSAGPG